MIATIKPRDIVGKTRRRLAVELIGKLEVIDKTIKTAEKDLKELVLAHGSTLMDLHGIGPGVGGDPLGGEAGVAGRGCGV